MGAARTIRRVVELISGEKDSGELPYGERKQSVNAREKTGNVKKFSGKVPT